MITAVNRNDKGRMLEVFNARYTLNKGLFAAFLSLLILSLVVNPSIVVSSIILLFAILVAQRALYFSDLYAKELWASFSSLT